jgi:hypothetical protein
MKHLAKVNIRNTSVTSMNYTQIAKIFNRRHNSIMHGVKCIDIQLTNKVDHSIKNDLISLKQNLLNYEQSRF